MKARTYVIALVGVAVVTAISGALSPASEPHAHAATATTKFIVGSETLAKPASGSRYIYVATNGSDVELEYQAWYNGGDFRSYNREVCLTDPTGATWGSQSTCTEPTIHNPLRTVALAMRVARPGDVVVIRGGSYSESVGWGVTPGTATRPITLQSRPGETVTVAGVLTLKNAHHWHVRGIRFTHNAVVQGSRQAIIAFAGGTGWRFENNYVTGSPGVANILVVSADTTATTSTARRAAAPQNFTIRSNCVTNNTGTGTHGQYHNIYMMSTLYSSGGLIERNLIAGAPRGANIKVAAPNADAGWTSPANLTIRDNTLLTAASGITVGLDSEYIEMTGNLIARAAGETRYDGAVKTYQLKNAGRIGFKDSFVADYKQVVEYDAAAPAPIFTQRIQTGSVTFSGTVSDCTIRPTTTPGASYGHLRSAEGGLPSDWTFTDVGPHTPFRAEIEWLAAAGVTSGYKDGSFRPAASVNRDAMAAFLYRLSGSPSFTPPPQSPFTDVTPASPFYKEILWLSAQRITTGYSDGSFRPLEPVSREAMAAFLHRYAGSPSTATDPSAVFIDVPSTHPFATAIGWLAESGVSTGSLTADGCRRFAPTQAVARDAMAAFMYRLEHPPSSAIRLAECTR